MQVRLWRGREGICGEMCKDPDFVFVGNYLCLDFVNTQVIKDGEIVDLIPAPDDLFRWLVAASVIVEDDADRLLEAYAASPEGSALLQHAHRLRGVMRTIATELAGGGRISEDSFCDINALMRACRGHIQLEDSGDKYRRVFVCKPKSPLRVLHPIAESAADLLCNGDASLVRCCANPRCILYFYDISKSHSRRWCSMSTCGNRVKVAEHYRRKRP